MNINTVKFIISIGLTLSLQVAATALDNRRPDEAKPLIPIRFQIEQRGYVTLVIEGSDGKRVRNLISHEAFQAGRHTVWWDGLDDLDRDDNAAKHAVFHIPGKIVSPGDYTVRGLVHPGIDLIYCMTPYTHGDPPWRTDDPGSQWLTNHSPPSDVIFLPPGAAPEREGKPSSKRGQLMICSKVAEGGSGLAWVDIDGHKLWGQSWLGGVWTAASHLAVDRGERPVEGVYAYAAASWAGDKYNDNKAELRLHKLVDARHRAQAPRDRRFGSGEDRPVLEPSYQIPFPEGTPDFDQSSKEERAKYAASLTGMAVHNGIVLCAFEKLDQLLFVDAHAGRVIGTASLPAPRGLAFGRDGVLYALSQGRLMRCVLDADNPAGLSRPRVLVTGLDDPQYVTVADDGTIYISDWGNSHQVKVFASDGTLRRAIGRAGPPRIGTYNPNHMNHPAGMALDDRGRLWVTEETHIPKRVSIWKLADRALVDAFYGPMRYGGSGAIDPQDKTRFFYDDDHGGTIEFKLNYKTGRSTPVAIPYLSRYNETGLIGRYTGAAPSYPLHHGRFLYLTEAYNLHTTGRHHASLYRVDDDGVARIVAAAGNILDARRQVLPAFTEPALQARMPSRYTPKADNALLFVWSDTNANQHLDADEVQFLDPRNHAAQKTQRPRIGTTTVTDDLAFTFSSVGDAVLQLKPVSISADGVPAYDIGQRRILATRTQSPTSSGGNQVLPADDGWLITTTPVEPLAREGLGGVRNGVPMWSYPSLWPGLHASHIAPMPDGPGQVIGTTRVVGPVIDAPPGSDAGRLWAINGNKGNVYIFTVDGLFVARLFQDSRTTSWNAPQATPGMNVNHLSLQEECFGPTWTRTKDGDVFLQAHFVGNIIQIKNLDKIRRLPDRRLTVTADQLTAAQRWNVEQEAKRQAEAAADAGPLLAAINERAPTVDGYPDEWKDARWVTIDERMQKVGNWGRRKNVTQAGLAVTSDTLYVIWRTHDQSLLRNSGESLTNLFKCGGALDLMIGVDPAADASRRMPVQGDQRILITRIADRTVAVLYEPVNPTYSAPAVEFGSPLRTLRFDRVQVISEHIELATATEKDLEADKDGNVICTTYEVAIPLKLLNFFPKSGTDYKFDIGILRGDGQQTLQRVYWHNKASGMVSDIPSEAELIPALWGTLHLQ